MVNEHFYPEIEPYAHGELEVDATHRVYYEQCGNPDGAPILFSGDTLFPGGPGATKFEGGDFPTIIRSIEDRFFRVLDDDVLVLPGHGDDTTIGTEKPHLDEWVARGW